MNDAYKKIVQAWKNNRTYDYYKCDIVSSILFFIFAEMVKLNLFQWQKKMFCVNNQCS